MHAQAIIQKFLGQECSSIHLKRRSCLALITGAAQHEGLGLLKLSRSMNSKAALRHRIKQCDRLLSNRHLADERTQIYRALAHRILLTHPRVAIIVDWSDLLADISLHILRASVVVSGRSITIYEEVHPTQSYNVAAVHCRFMKALRATLPEACQPIIISDAGFRSTWFRMLDQLGFAWVGRVRNRDMMRQQGEEEWRGCKTRYADATGRVKDFGLVEYVRKNPMQCRMVLIKKEQKGRTRKTAFGKKTQSAHSKKQAQTQREPWLLAVSTNLNGMSASDIVKWYSYRMQIEQTFRDLKNPQWGMGLSTSQTRKPQRIAALLLIGTLLSFALWLIGLFALSQGYRVQYGSRAKASKTVSILTLARHWLNERNKGPTMRQLDQALTELRAMIMTYEI